MRAASQVFNTPELVENILLFLPVYYIFALQRLSRNIRILVQDAVFLQKIFRSSSLAPAQDYVSICVVNPLVIEATASTLGSATIGFRDQWLNMQLFMPPIRRVWCQITTPGHPPKTIDRGSKSRTYYDGVTLRDYQCMIRDARNKDINALSIWGEGYPFKNETREVQNSERMGANLWTHDGTNCSLDRVCGRWWEDDYAEHVPNSVRAARQAMEQDSDTEREVNHGYAGL